MKSLPFYFGSKAFESHSETVETALNSIVENASRYRELMSTCDPHGLAFGRQLIERKQHGNHGQHVTFQIAQPETSKLVLCGVTSESKQALAQPWTSELSFPTNSLFQCHENQEKIPFKKPLPSPSKVALADYMPESKRKVLSQEKQGLHMSLMQCEKSVLHKHQKSATPVIFGVADEAKLAEKRKLEEQVTTEFFATHKRFLVAGSANCDQSSAPQACQQTLKEVYEKRKEATDYVVNEEFSLSSAVFSQKSIEACPKIPKESQEIREDFIEVPAITQEGSSQGEAPVRNSLFWVYRCFPHLDEQPLC